MDKIIGLIGLSKRAGKLAGGDTAVTSSIKDRSARLVIMALDASDNTKKNIKNSCKYYNADWIEYSTVDELGAITGSAKRAAVAIKDRGFAEAIRKHFENIEK